MDLSRYHDLALRLAPELCSQPLYLIRQPADLPRPAVCAYAINGPCQPLRKSLQRAGQWRGWGPAIVVVNDLSSQAALVMILHELAHLLPAVPILKPLRDDEQLAELRAWAATPGHAMPGPLWQDGHGREFTRTALHLWWRAAVLAHEVADLDPLCGGWRYSLSPAFAYWHALGSEPLRMQGQSFAEILRTPEPPEFRDLWHADLEAWRLRNPQVTL